MSVADADKYKDEGNQLFKNGNYARAVVLYGKAIEAACPSSDGYESDSSLSESGVGDLNAAKVAFPDLYVYYANRALAQIKLENYGCAISDAGLAIELNPSFSKAYYRRGVSKVALAHYKDAMKDFDRCCQLSPNDADARLRLKECKKEYQAQQFAKAIATDVTAKISDTVKIESMVVPDDYDGPRFEGPLPTVEFLNALIEYQKNEKLIHPKYAYKIALQSLKLLSGEQSSLVHIPMNNERSCSKESSPPTAFTICGDIHGQYYDLINIFEINGKPSECNPYLFNGDFVDRGSFSVECLLVLFAFKLAYPRHMFLARGNHETKAMNRLYGFEGEITAKYDPKLYSLFCEVFCALPLAHVINNKIFVVHGGLFSQDNVSLEEIGKIDRFKEPPEEGLMAEMLWADPIAVRGRHPSKRGLGLSFGPDVTENFLRCNGLQCVVRSHEVKDEGYEIEHGGKLITVFSAPNYCDQMNNKGALLRISFPPESVNGDAHIDYVKFAAAPHPPVRAMQYANRALFGSAFGQ